MLSPIVVSRIKRKYTKNDLHKGIVNELEKLLPRMVWAAYSLEQCYGRYDKDFIRWSIKNLEKNIKSTEGSIDLINVLKH